MWIKHAVEFWFCIVKFFFCMTFFPFIFICAGKWKTIFQTLCAFWSRKNEARKVAFMWRSGFSCAQLKTFSQFLICRCLTPPLPLPFVPYSPPLQLHAFSTRLMDIIAWPRPQRPRRPHSSRSKQEKKMKKFKKSRRKTRLICSRNCFGPYAVVGAHLNAHCAYATFSSEAVTTATCCVRIESKLHCISR